MTRRERIKKLKNLNCAEEDVFYQAMEEILISISPVLEKDKKYEENSIIERLIIPDRIITFKVSWLDD